MSAAAAGGAAAAAAISQAIKASGSLIRIHPEEFSRMISKMDDGIVVETTVKFFSTSYKYLTSYKGLVFFTKSSNQLSIPSRLEKITASSMWMPS
ncbi:hypothetical protein ACFCT7_08470 [Fulvivirgaceae bacterium LMO-SS25]